MNTAVECLVEREENVEELELVEFVELGTVSGETRGTPFGGRLDAGFGYKF